MASEKKLVKVLKLQVKRSEVKSEQVLILQEAKYKGMKLISGTILVESTTQSSYSIQVNLCILRE